MSGKAKSKTNKSKSKNNNGQLVQNDSNGGHVVYTQVPQSSSLDMTHMNSVQGPGQSMSQGPNMYPPPYMSHYQSQHQNQAVSGNLQALGSTGYANLQGQCQGQAGQQTHQTSVQYDQGGSSYNSLQQNSLNNSTNFDSNTIVTMIQQMNNNFMGRLSSIETSVSKLSSIESEMSLMRSDLSKLQLDNATISRRMTEVERSCQMISNMYDDASKSNTELHNNMSHLQTDQNSLSSKVEENVSRFEVRCNTLKDELLELKARSMQSNLVFYGLTEAPKGEPDNTESKLKDFLKHELSFDNPETVNNIVFDRVHRLGRPRRDQSSYPRPIVAKFERYRDRELIRNAGRELNDKNNGYNIREQFPPEIEARRKLLYPVMRSYQRDPKNRVALVRDKLYINGTLYESNITNNSDISQSRQQYSAEPLKSSARNRRFVRGVRLVERHPIETHNPFDALRMDNDDSQGMRDQSSTVGKRPASSPAHEDRETKKYMYQGNDFGTISEHVESGSQLSEMEAEITDIKNDDAHIPPSEIDIQVQQETSNVVNGQITVNAEIHSDYHGSSITGQPNTSEINVNNTDSSQ